MRATVVTAAAHSSCSGRAMRANREGRPGAVIGVSTTNSPSAGDAHPPANMARREITPAARSASSRTPSKSWWSRSSRWLTTGVAVTRSSRWPSSQGATLA
jgi:hypothetical protein